MEISYDPLLHALKNPYRPDTKKALAFEVFRGGGERKELIARIAALGVKEATAASWLDLFRRRAKQTGPEAMPKWLEDARPRSGWTRWVVTGPRVLCAYLPLGSTTADVPLMATLLMPDVLVVKTMISRDTPGIEYRRDDVDGPWRAYTEPQ